MEEGIGSWFGHQHSDWQSPKLNMLSAPFDLGQQNTVPPYMNPSSNLVSSNGTLLESYVVPPSKASQQYEPRGWFYGLPRYRQAFAPVLNSVPKEKLIASPNENCGDLGDLGTGSGCAPKRFLVFDQSGDNTILIFSSGIGTPVNCLPSWPPKPSNTFNPNKEEVGTKRDASNPSGPFSLDEFNEQDNEDDDVQSEMHENTEELDALLYSDDENDYSEDDEVTSTGHSPSTMTAYDKQELSLESGEEVASSARTAKRQKISNGGFDMPSLVDSASSVKTNRCFECDSDAESSCGNSKNQVFGESGSLSGNQRSKKEKIRESISILESIIPDGKGKDAIVVIDEAIHYLRSLKDKAKALGLDSV